MKIVYSNSVPVLYITPKQLQYNEP